MDCGIDTQYAIAIVVPGRANSSADEIIRLRNRGLDLHRCGT